MLLEIAQNINNLYHHEKYITISKKNIIDFYDNNYNILTGVLLWYNLLQYLIHRCVVAVHFSKIILWW
jgi:hypothetical protein